ncbi:N-acetylmuramoyl-L-alanine amidase [Gordonia sp. NPDC003585]|uniref:N-acetylmuramoyl-L-alanine amidase n=1 Tax=Gordonia sp. NPDC003585 TaxID=3154275 RepID=UPI0033A6CDF8
MRRLIRAVAVAGLVVVIGACSTTDPPGPTSPPYRATSAYASASASSTPSAAPCDRTVVALDPGHNPVTVDGFDPVTGVRQVDYPNGAEDRDVFLVAQRVRAALSGVGYRVVLLKRSVRENVTYRQRVERARAAGADIAVSIHTSPGVNAVFPQRVGLYREGTGADGEHLRVVFTNRATAVRSQRYARLIAARRTAIEGHPVAVTDNDFGGRAPLWSGNIPVIALIADDTPWVYNEFGTAGAGGSIAVPRSRLEDYARGLTAGVRAAVPVCAVSR